MNKGKMICIMALIGLLGCWLLAGVNKGIAEETKNKDDQKAYEKYANHIETALSEIEKIEFALESGGDPKLLEEKFSNKTLVELGNLEREVIRPLISPQLLLKSFEYYYRLLEVLVKIKDVKNENRIAQFLHKVAKGFVETTKTSLKKGEVITKKDCSLCKGEGTIDCYWCQSEQKGICPNCKGKNCSSCDKTGICPVCLGRGCVVCPICVVISRGHVDLNQRIEKEQQLKRLYCQNKLRGLRQCLEIISMSNEKGGYPSPNEILPALFEEMVGSLEDTRYFICPNTGYVPTEKDLKDKTFGWCSYEVTKDQIGVTTPDDKPIIWDKKGNHKDGRHVVLFDCRIIFLSENDFQTLLNTGSVPQPRIEAKETNAMSKLRTLVSCEATWRQQDLDGNGKQDFWTYDVSCFYRMLRPNGKPEEAIDITFAKADIAPAKDDIFGKGKIVPWQKKVLSPIPKAGYFFRALLKDAEGNTYNQNKLGKVTATNDFCYGFIAYPAEYGKTGVRTFIVNQAGTIYSTDCGNDDKKIVLQWPGDDPTEIKGPGGKPWSVEE